MSIKIQALTFVGFSVIAINGVQRMQILNASNQSVNIGLTVPAKTEANVKFKPLGDTDTLSLKRQLQMNLLKAVLIDSADDIRHAVKCGARVNHVYDSIKIQGPDKPNTPMGSGKISNSVLSLAIKFNRYNAIRTLIELNAEITDEDLQSLSNVDVDQKWSIMKLLPNFAIHAKTVLRSMLMSTTTFSEEESIAAIMACMNAGWTIDEIWDYIQDIRLQPKALEFMLKNGINPNKPFYQTCNGKLDTRYYRRALCTYLSNHWNGQPMITETVELIKLLIAYGADLTLPIYNHGAGDVYPLEYCSAYNYSAEVMLWLVENGVTH